MQLPGGLAGGVSDSLSRNMCEKLSRGTYRVTVTALVILAIVATALGLMALIYFILLIIALIWGITIF